MGSKIIAIIGLVVSAAFVYFCVDMKKDTIAVKCDLGKQIDRLTGDGAEITDEKIVEVRPDQTVESSTRPVVYEKSDPAFGIILGDQINVVGMFEPKEKEGPLAHYIEEICSDAVCINDIRYSDDIKHVSWGEEIVKLIQFMRKERIKGGSLYINSNILHIEGEIVTPQQKRRLAQLKQEIKKVGLLIEDKTTIKSLSSVEKAPAVSEKMQESHAENKIEKVASKEKRPSIGKMEVPKEVVQESVVIEAREKAVTTTKAPAEVPPKETKATQDSSGEDETISQILSQNPITFISNSNQLSAQSQKMLDRVAESLQSAPDKKVLIKVCVHTGDDRMVNMIIAQKRATLIQRYLRKKGIKKSTTQGSACDGGQEMVSIELVE